MAAAKRYSVERVVAKLREHEKLQGQGLTIPQACKRIGIYSPGGGGGGPVTKIIAIIMVVLAILFGGEGIGPATYPPPSPTPTPSPKPIGPATSGP